MIFINVKLYADAYNFILCVLVHCLIMFCALKGSYVGHVSMLCRMRIHHYIWLFSLVYLDVLK